MHISRYIDHAVLKPQLSQDEAKSAIELGVKHNVKTVCVRPMDIALARSICEGTSTEVSTVLAFPHGCTTPAVKSAEAACYIQDGAQEIDMVANYALIRSAKWDALLKDMCAVTDIARPANICLKVILETCLLSEAEIHRATLIAIEAGADFVKTSTGFAQHGATENAVRQMLKAAEGRILVKASGGIRSYDEAARYIQMGVARLGVGYTTTPILCEGTASISSEEY